MDYKAIGHRVQRMRKTLRYTQEQLAERAGISLSFLGHIERGTRKMSMETLVKFALHLKCSTDYLLGVNTVPKPVYVQAFERLHELVDAEIASLENPQPFYPPIHNQDFT